MNLQKRLFFTSFVIALFGLAFYLTFRFGAFGSSQHWLLEHSTTFTSSPLAISHWLPSFVFVILMSIFSAALTGVNHRSVKSIPAGWLALSIIMECLQSAQANFVLFWGTFDVKDLAASFAGSIVSMMILRYCVSDSYANKSSTTRQTALLLFGATLSMASNLGGPINLESGTDTCTFPDGNSGSCDVKPIYLSFSDMRDNDAIYFSAENATDDTQPFIDQGAPTNEFSGLRVPGKIYVYGDKLFINDRLRGVYIFDNRNPESPNYLGYINVIGATDMEVLDGVMYINSFTDIVAIDMQPPFTMVRTENLLAYPYDPIYLPNGARFFDKEQNKAIIIDRNFGIVIGYENEREQRFLFWDLDLQGTAL